jgi:hypothetical protein
MTTSETTLQMTHAEIHSAKSSGYLQQLCKHFGHKIPVDFTPEKGEIRFPFGTCGLSAKGDSLMMTVSAADDEALVRMQQVIGSHLLRFAFREDLEINWIDGVAA